MKLSPNISCLPISHLQDQDLLMMDEIFQCIYRESSPHYDEGSYLQDEVDYRALRNESRSKNRRELGHIFFLRKEERLIGFLLALDDLSYEGSPADFLYQLKGLIQEDIDFISSLVYLERFAFVLQIALAPEWEHSGWGKMLIDQVVHYYKGDNASNKSAIIIATTIHQGQFRIFDFLRNSGEGYQFLDQQFSEDPADGIRFRVAHLLNKKSFFNRIEKKTLHKTFDIVIPIQLNLASQDVNSLIDREPFQAKILWSSFFTNNQQLRKLGNMRQSYHGYYQSLRDARDYDHYKQLIRTLAEVTRYLQAKDKSNKEVVSLTPNLKQQGFEFFFINDHPGDFEFPSFANPIVYNLFDREGPRSWLHQAEFHAERNILSKKDKIAWRKVFRDYVEHCILGKGDFKPEVIREWSEWKWRLKIDTATEQRLILAQRAIINKTHTAADKNLFYYVSNGKMVSDAKLKGWNKWLQLHVKLYQSDLQAIRKKENYWWCHAVIPITFTEGVSGIMFTFLCPKAQDPKYRQRLFNDLAVTISSALAKNMLNIIGKLQQHVISMAMDRYANAAISVRNLSHNVGSHVLSHLGQEEVLQQLLFSEGALKKEGIGELGKLNVYLRIRMSLLADMATNDPVASVPTYLNREVLDSFRQQKLLLGYLAGPYSGLVDIRYENHTNRKATPHKDILIQLPNGELGLSAFHMILINIFRNAVKHAPVDRTNQHPLKLIVRVESPNHGKRGYQITIYDSTLRPCSEVARMARRFQKEYVNGKLVKEYELRNVGLGFAEMLVAARYLRKRPFGASWGPPERRISFLDIVSVPNAVTAEQDKAHLGFQIYLKKPRLIVVIDSDNRLQLDDMAKAKLEEMGVKLRTQADIDDSHSEVHSHSITIDLDGYYEKQKVALHRFYPVRWITDRAGCWRLLHTALQQADREKFFYYAWEAWMEVLTRRVGASTGRLCIFYPQPVVRKSQLNQDSIIFDSHGEGFRTRRLQEPSHYRFYESFGGLSPTKLPIDNLLGIGEGSFQRRRLELELEEAAITRVIIVDERIQQICKDLSPPYSVPVSNYFEYLEGMNIMLPDPNAQPELDLNKAVLRYKESKDLVAYLKPYLNGGAEFVVIHLGLIDQLVADTGPTYIQDWLNNLFVPGKAHAELVLISGRGKPQQLPKTVRFLPYNNIAKYVLEIPAKYHLCKMLYGSRTRI